MSTNTDWMARKVGLLRWEVGRVAFDDDGRPFYQSVPGGWSQRAAEKTADGLNFQQYVDDLIDAYDERTRVVSAAHNTFEAVEKPGLRLVPTHDTQLGCG